MENSDPKGNAFPANDSESSYDSRLLLLHPSDNVLILICNIDAGDSYSVGLQSFISPQPIGLGHKIARVDIPNGGKVLKYGAPIGSASQSILKGEHVHLQNLKSDYLPTYTLDKEHRYATDSH
jgi:hypothetical protein